jgi:hypothetical protein
MESHMLRLEMMKLSRLWPHQPDSAEWWQRIKAQPSYAAREHQLAAAGR